MLVAYWIGIQAPLCFVLRRFSGVKSVVLLHNFTSHERIPFVESLWKMILGASADGFITLSGSVRRELMQFSPSARAVELFHPVYDPFGLLPSKEEARLQLGLGSKEQVLLFFGYVRHYKGLDMLLEALALAGAQGSPIRLIVAGEFFQNVETYRELARALGVAGHVSLEPGYVPPERVATLFCAADAVVLPYRAASQSGVVQLAFGHNTPVIVNDTGGLAGQVDHRRTGWVVADPSPRTLAEAIVAFFRERESLQMEEHIREVRNSRSWSRFGAGAGKFLNEVKNEGHVG
jgi:glycosyltransferase involved in cell wall biosynthesis